MQPDQEIINRWNRTAPFWEKHREVIGQMLAPITPALVEDAHVGVNQTVLDVGTGPGEPALSLARIVGQAGRICGIDPSSEMVACARNESVRLRLKNVQLGYTFTKKVLGNLPVENLRIFANAFNLFTWDEVKRVDPEADPDRNNGYFYPQQRIINFGLNVGF